MKTIIQASPKENKIYTLNDNQYEIINQLFKTWDRRFMGSPTVEIIINLINNTVGGFGEYKLEIKQNLEDIKIKGNKVDTVIYNEYIDKEGLKYL